MTDAGSGFFYRSLRTLNDQNEDQSSNHESARNILGQRKQAVEFQLRNARFSDDLDIDEINRLLRGDLVSRTLEVTDKAEALFSDEAESFPINSSFISNFQGSFLNATFLNGMISKFLCSTEQHPLENIQPLQYFVSSHSSKPVNGRIPDLMLVRLIEGCTRDGAMSWNDLQALLEHTVEQKPQIRMVKSTIAKDYVYLSFCAQFERDFIINLLITGEGFHIVTADRTGLSDVGRATKIYSVQTEHDSIFVLKDSWMSIHRPHETTYLEGISFPFCPTLIHQSSHESTLVKQSLVKEIREKRRSVTRPLGVHISDFSSLWELMVAFLDITLAIVFVMREKRVHRDYSYANILLREPGGDTDEAQHTRDKFMEDYDLSEIDVMRRAFKYREGLLIDYDYVAELCQEDEGEYVFESEGEDKDKAKGHGGTRSTAHATTHRGENVTGVRTGTFPSWQ